jgi:putative membrane protein
MNMDLPMSAELHAHLQSWSLPLASALALVALVYLRGWLRFRRDSPNLISHWRVAAFISSLCFLWMIVGSPLCALDHDLLTIHMINHLVLMVIVAPLMLAGTPVLLLSGLRARVGRSLYDLVLRNASLQRLGRFFKHPVFCWLCATATVIGWHLPSVFRLAMRSHWWHAAEYVSFMFAGLVFWLPAIQPVSNVHETTRWSTPLYLFFATLPCDILSAFLAFCGRVVYRPYLSAPHLFNLSALQDQQCAGALMWVSVTFAYLLPAAVITIQILSPVRTDSQPEVTPLQQGIESVSL